MNRIQILIKVGKRIKAKRLAKNMTQSDLAMECGFEKASLSRIEAGKTNITIRTLYKISYALGIHIAKLFVD